MLCGCSKEQSFMQVGRCCVAALKNSHSYRLVDVVWQQMQASNNSKKKKNININFTNKNISY